jgi:hypothetical protein
MNANAFLHHSGGVVQVQHVARYGSVPESLLEDIRLDLDSRAVAAWLAVKPSGWQISVMSLRMRLSIKDKKMLGKDRWQRIARELESAGYLFRKKINGNGGQWVWHITFNPVPATVGGFPDSGAAERGGPANGIAENGQPGYKVVPILELPKKKTTTTKAFSIVNSDRKKFDRNCATESNCGQILLYPHVTQKELSELEILIQLCRADTRQSVLDEIEGIRRTGGIKRGVVPLARTLINKVETGEFSLSAGFLVQVEREKRSQNKKAVAVAMAAPTGVSSLISEEIIAKLPPNIAKRVREAAARVNSSDLAKSE